MASTPVQTVTRQVKPLLSLNSVEARRRVFNLYKAWIRNLPFILHEFDIPKNQSQLKAKVREEFLKNRHVKDVRAIDMLVIKQKTYKERLSDMDDGFVPDWGQMELKETTEKWKNKGNLMYYFKDTVEPKPNDFLSKFMAGHDP